MKTIAQLIEELFHTHRRADGREYTYKEIVAALDGKVEQSHLSKLRTGKITNPSRETLLALCRFFQVSPTYFFPELDILPQPAVPATADESLQFVLRSSGLRPEVQSKLQALIQALRHDDEEGGQAP